MTDSDEILLDQFRAILENTHRFLALLSPEGVLLEINAPTLRALHLGRDEVINKYIWDTLWWRGRIDAQQKLKKAVRRASQGKAHHFISRISENANAPATVNFTLRPIKSGDGEVIYLLQEAQDITDLIKSIDQLQNSQRILEQANRIARLGYWSWDISTGRIKISDELNRIFAKNEDADIHNYQQLLRYAHPEDRIIVHRRVQSALDNRSKFYIQFRITQKDGEVRTLRSLGQVLVDDSDEITQVIGTAQDITEIKTLEDRLIESEKRYRFLVQELPDIGVILFDDDLSVFLVDGSILKTRQSRLGIGKGVLVTDFLAETLGVSGELGDVALFEQVFNGKTHSYEQISGEDCYSVSVLPLRNSENEIYAGMAVIQNITQRVRVAEKLTDLANQLRLLNHLGQVVVSNQTTQYIFKEVLARTREMISARGAFIILEETGSLMIVAHDDENDADLNGLEIPFNKGCAADVWRDQEGMILTGEECQDKVFKPMAQILRYNPLSFVAVPITWQDQKFGVLGAVHPEEDKFSQDDLKLAESAAIWTALALNNALQHERLERRLAESEITTHLLEEILSSRLSLESVLQHVVDAGKNLVPKVDWAAIHLLNERDNSLPLKAVAGINVPPEEYTLEVGQGIAGRVITSSELISVADVSQDERVASYPRKSRALSLLVAPIGNRDGDTIGTITLQSSNPGQFSSEDENLISLLGHQAGLAIENARLYETAERQQRVAKMQRERLRQFAHRIVMAQEEERERIARELHDESGQSLIALKISLDSLVNKLPEEMAETRELVSKAAEQAALTMDNLRSIAHNLRPPALDRLGLNLALSDLCRQYQSMTKIQTIYEEIQVPRLPSSHEITFYRFVQEALTNVAKHAEATEVRVWGETKTGRVEIHIQDNGKGLPTGLQDMESEFQRGMGLTSLEERLNMIDGSLDIQTTPGEGTHLCASVAFQPRDFSP